MLVVLALAAIAVVAVTVKVSQGHGGEMAVFPPDVPPLAIPQGRLEAADLARLQLPIGLVGYQTDAVDATLERVAASLGERDLHIAALEQRLAELVTARLYGRPMDDAVATQDEPAADDASGDGASPDEDRNADDATPPSVSESADDGPQTEQPEEQEQPEQADRLEEPEQAERLEEPAEHEQAESRDPMEEQPEDGAEPRRQAVTATLTSTGTREESA
ncbi:hypothetical protein [Microtetraspora fusca]|uniref:hypothetical protein n=1 Tax=Microtetraspora fusca TaxID=1997 RepID=UPI0012F7D4A8|nr:hypothetical protein [Microtetraspora fusca]